MLFNSLCPFKTVVSLLNSMSIEQPCTLNKQYVHWTVCPLNSMSVERYVRWKVCPLNKQNFSRNSAEFYSVRKIHRIPFPRNSVLRNSVIPFPWNSVTWNSVSSEFCDSEFRRILFRWKKSTEFRGIFHVIPRNSKKFFRRNFYGIPEFRIRNSTEI